MSGNQRKVVIEIGGSTYKIITDLGDDVLEWIQEHINSRLHEIQKEAFFQLDQERAYLYTALNLAEEIYNLQSELEKVKTELKQLTQRISNELKKEDDEKQ